MRKIRQVSTAQTQLEGGGFQVRRPVPVAGGVRMVDPILMIDEMGPVDYRPGAAVKQSLPEERTGLLYVFSGGLDSSGTHLDDGQIGVLDEGDMVELAVPASAISETQVLLLGGVPLNEPVARRGPIVMNTPEELDRAYKDYQAGRMGEIN